MRKSNDELKPRNGHTLVVGVVARISGCASQKEQSLDDQVDHAKEEVAELYSGPIDYRIIATKGKGERLDRPELVEVEQMLRSRELDLLIMEDVGRLVRGAEAVAIWGIAVDHGTRCLAPNDCLDTADETWEEELIAACRDHVGHNTHTSKRIKKKLMNRFKKNKGATPLPIAGYVKPDGAKTFDDWRIDETATPIIREALDLLRRTKNCSAVADFLNEKKLDTGPYRRRKEWQGDMVRSFFKNPILAGHPQRGRRCTKKHHESGRRVSVPNTETEPITLDLPHLAHVDADELTEVNALLDEANAHYRRSKTKEDDPRACVPRKRTRFPAQHAICYYCGHSFVWGGNGRTPCVMCSGSRKWNCWNGISFDGALASCRIIDKIMATLDQFDGIEKQYRMIVEQVNSKTLDVTTGLDQVRRDEAELSRKRKNLLDAIKEVGMDATLKEGLSELNCRGVELGRERLRLERIAKQGLKLPKDIAELKECLKKSIREVAANFFEASDLLQALVPEFHVYLVRLLDGGRLLPRARIRLNLLGSIPDAEHVPELKALLDRVVTIDLFKKAPQHERIRKEAVALAAEGLKQREIAKALTDENPKQVVVCKALALQKTMNELGLSSPYAMLSEPPDDRAKIRRYRKSRYDFKPLDGYEPPAINE